MKAVVAVFNQEKALEGAFSVIVQLNRLIVYSTVLEAGGVGEPGAGPRVALQPALPPLLALLVPPLHPPVLEPDLHLTKCQLELFNFDVGMNNIRRRHSITY